MQSDAIQHLLSAAQVSLEDPRFFPAVFHAVAEERKQASTKDGDNLRRVCAEEYDELSLRLDNTRIQDSASVRNVLRTRRIANLLVSDKGEIHLSLIPVLINHLKSYFYSWGVSRQVDVLRQQHIVNTLTALNDNKELQRLLRQISRPYLHPLADQIIRDTLLLPENTVITDAHARRAALSAWLCYLRQNVGSCFATAPAIIVHDEQPELFLTDLHEILGSGRLKRTFEGVEYAVPISSSWGAGDLRRAVLLTLYPSQDHSEVWYSPGLLIALEEATVLNPESSLEEKIALAKEKVQQAFPEWSVQHPYVLTNVSEILSRILMKHIGITAEDIKEYELRPQGMVHSGLMMQTAHLGAISGKGELCATYKHNLERAESAFKALADNALLKAWEFTMASFAETKSEFTRWNLYASLGLGPEEPGGIGQSLYVIIKRKLDQYNNKVQDLQLEYEYMFAQVKQLEQRMRYASSEQEAHWVRAEYEVKANEFYLLEDLRNEAHAKAQTYANLFNILIDYYDKLFPEHFQEVYDPDLHEVQTGPYDDSPAGFRLLFKHGRTNTAQWTRIKNPQEFVDALARFFTSTERELTAMDTFKGMENDISDIVTSVVTHIKTEEFLETAFYRMAAAHKVPAIAHPLENLDKISTKPWAYISGGTMTTLVSCYFRRDQKPTEVERWVENPMELCVFFVDALKQTPPIVMEPFLKNPNKAMIVHSPTHAFLIKPGMSPFKEAWQTDAYTYTWVRDQLVKPMEAFVEQLDLDEEMQDHLIQKLSELIPINYQPYFRKTFSHMIGHMAAPDFRDYVLDKTEHERGLRHGGMSVLSSEEFDTLLYQMLPLFPAGQLKEKILSIIDNIPEISGEVKSQLQPVIEEAVDRVPSRHLIGSRELQDICQGLLCAAYGSTSVSVDIPGGVCRAAQKLRFTMPTPIQFADTNWVRDNFAFVVSPGTKMLELWRVDPSGVVGSPMTTWREWLNGVRKHPMWGVYTRPTEYTGAVPTIGLRMRM